MMVRHYFVDELMPDRNFSAGEFGERGRAVIREILSRRVLPIVVGGSGLYVRSLIDGFFEGPGADKDFREAMERLVRAGRLHVLLDELRRVDPSLAATIDPTKPRRVIRGLEVYHLTGRPLSALHQEKKVDVGFRPFMVGLAWPRLVLYRRIDMRCERMVASGLLAEVEKLESMGFTDSLNALNTVGYAEAFSYRRGEISYSEFVRLFKQNSRRYAKRQLTWFRRDPRIHWVAMVEEKALEEVVEEIITHYREFSRDAVH
jgi:tRNA dimethylallyltransferase